MIAYYSILLCNKVSTSAILIKLLNIPTKNKEIFFHISFERRYDPSQLIPILRNPYFRLFRRMKCVTLKQ